MGRTIVVVGGVAGGASCAARLRRLDESARIVVLERGEHVAFASCGLPYFISGEIEEGHKLMVTTPERFTRRFGIDVRIRHEAITIDRQRKSVQVVDHQSGQTYALSYDKLVLSPGAAPLRPGLPGAGDERIFTLRTIDDAERIRAYIESNDPHTAVVVGGGFIGLEMTESLAHLGLHVTLIELTDQVMTSLDLEMAEWIHQHLRMNGIELMLGQGVEQFAVSGDGSLLVSTSYGNRVNCDLAILAMGVKPEAELARQAGLRLGPLGGIRVNEHLQTNDPDIYAIGDAIEVQDGILGVPRRIPLANLANRQGRLAADHICGKEISYANAYGTSVIRVFDLTVASTGVNEKHLAAEGVPYRKSYTHPASHAGYYPGAVPMVMKLLFAPDTGRIFGGQIVGIDGVDKRIDVLATAIQMGATVSDLARLELAYAPPFGTAKDAINIAGYVASNVLEGDLEIAHAEEVECWLAKGAFLLDVRTVGEFHRGHLDGAVNIPIDEIRSRLTELPVNKTLVVYCLTGIRSYFVCRLLRQHGYRALNLSGGYMIYCAMYPNRCDGIPGLHRWKRALALETFCSTPEERSVVRRNTK
ncbi:MAG TPA: FAD-dependent oxidoreductase [Armatimonadota bacterium]|nr:FAD-dependent oxidoreductase [Armatimonadota bacterium]